MQTSRADEPRDCWRLVLLQRFIGFFGLLMVAATWRLWTPAGEFPRVPLIYAAGRIPIIAQWILAIGLPVSLLATALYPSSSKWRRHSLLGFVLVYLALVLIDQQRLQPWAYALAIMALVLWSSCGAQSISLLRAFVVSIYVYSGWAKLDYTFAHTLGTQFVDELSRLFHLPLADLSSAQKAGLALLFPTTELVVAIGLTVPRLRTWGVGLAIVMHLLLLLVIGPFGLAHKPAVLLWNLFFIAQDLLLFTVSFRWVTEQPPATSLEDSSRRRRFAIAVVAAAIVLPLLEPFGFWDHWLAWGLYAPRASRANLFVHESAVEKIPEELQPYIQPSGADEVSAWRVVQTDRWSLDTRHVPIYPQSRTQLAIGAALLERFNLGGASQIAVSGPADRWTGEREQTVLRSAIDVDAALGRHWINARPTVPLPLVAE